MIDDIVSMMGRPVIKAGVAECLLFPNLVQSAKRSPDQLQTAAVLETHCRNVNAFCEDVSLIEEDISGPVPWFS
jgi:hypothetical protein